MGQLSLSHGKHVSRGIAKLRKAGITDLGRGAKTRHLSSDSPLASKDATPRRCHPSPRTWAEVHTLLTANPCQSITTGSLEPNTTVFHAAGCQVLHPTWEGHRSRMSLKDILWRCGLAAAFQLCGMSCPFIFWYHRHDAGAAGSSLVNRLSPSPSKVCVMMNLGFRTLHSHPHLV